MVTQNKLYHLLGISKGLKKARQFFQKNVSFLDAWKEDDILN